MNYKIIITIICLLALNACDDTYFNSSHPKPVKDYKVEKGKLTSSQGEKQQQHHQSVKEFLDNKVFLLLNTEEGCIVSEKPLNSEIIIVYKEDEKFTYDLVNPILKKENTDCVSNLAYVTDEPNYFYSIDKKSKINIRGYGLVVNKSQIMYENGKIRGVDLIGDGVPNILTECFSNEGSHFNIWGGANSEEKLLHRYTYLDMDLEPSCTENDKISNLGLLDLK
ncbi:hypothetical protein [Acinetobacter shaoyimingii]|nr:hypothetical protein [Acinetobacter shaoyimingii]